METEVVLEQLEECDVCGSNHKTDQCPELGLKVLHTVPQQVSKARLSVPHNLMVVEVDDGSSAVVAKEMVPAKTQFGPFEARRTTQQFDDSNLFVLKILVNNTGVTLDTSDEDSCNWMCLVRTAHSPEDQNCIAYQMGINVFFSTIQDIPPGHELRVWYAPPYARKLGKSVSPDGATLMMLGQDILRLLPTMELVQLTVAQGVVPDEDSGTAGQMALEEQMEEGEMEDEETEEPGEIFTCGRCQESFDSQVNLAKHLREHILPTKTRPKKTRYRCTFCRVGFQNVSNYNRHMQRHKGMSLKCPHCDFVCYRGDNFHTHLRARHNEDITKYMDLDQFRLISESEPGQIKALSAPAQSGGSVPIKRGRGRPRKYPRPNEILALAARESGADQMVAEEEGVRIEVPETITVLVETAEDSNGGTTMTAELVSGVGTQTEISESGEEGEESLQRRPADSNSQDGASVLRDQNSVAYPIMYNKDGSIRKKPGRKRKSEAAPTPSIDDNFIYTDPVKLLPDESPGSQDEGRRVQPRRSLKGKRTTGKLAGITWVKMEPMEDEEEETVVERRHPRHEEGGEVPVKRGRGRPRLHPRPDQLIQQRKEAAAAAAAGIAATDTESASESQIQDNAVTGLVSQEAAAETAEEGEKGDKTEEEEEEAEKEKAALEEGEEEEEEEEELEEGEVDETSDGVEYLDDEDDEGLGDDDIPHRDMDDSEDYRPANMKLPQTDSDSNLSFEDRPIRKRTRRGRPPGRTPRSLRNEEVENMIRVVMTDDREEYVCTVCEKKFSDIRYIRLHIPAHTDRFKCQTCERRFVRHESLMRHNCSVEQEYHIDTVTGEDGEESFQCGVCGLLSSSMDAARNHFILHKGVYKCDKCDQKFPSKQQLLEHVCGADEEGGSGDEHTCEICRQSFRNEKYLFRHMAMHTDLYKCKNCNKCFSRKDSMQRHVLKCDKDNLDSYNMYYCRNCTKPFSTRLGLENHILHCASYHCQKCRTTFFNEGDFDRHDCSNSIVDENTSVQFPCGVCNKTFSNLAYLQRHEASHQGAFQCELCNKQFCRKEELAWHSRMCQAAQVIQQQGNVECDICHKTFDEAKVFRDHYHEHTHPHQCERCGKRFIKVGTLHSHKCERLLPDGIHMLSCEVCGKEFRREKYLERHQVVHGNPQYECEYCHRSFYRRDCLNDHACKLPDGTPVRIVRKRNRVLFKDSLVCQQCGKMFVSTSNLNKHVKTHGEKMCHCEHCGKSFHCPNYLRQHIASVHERRYQFQCSECGKILQSKTGLIAHMKQFHTDDAPLFPCPTCGKIFRQKGNMRTHMYSHSKDRLFICKVPSCAKTFKYPDQLNRHKLEHTMVHKLQCDLCDKKFCKPYELRKHQETFHSGKVFVCAVCNERCSHRHTIIRHYKRKHPDMTCAFSDPKFLEGLQKTVEPGEVQEVVVETAPGTSLLSQAMQTLEEGGGTYTTMEVQDSSLLPHAAAEVLQNLAVSNTVYATTEMLGDETTITLPQHSIQHAIEGPDGQPTVVILQIVNQDDTDIVEEVLVQQEVE